MSENLIGSEASVLETIHEVMEKGSEADLIDLSQPGPSRIVVMAENDRDKGVFVLLEKNSGKWNFVTAEETKSKYREGVLVPQDQEFETGSKQEVWQIGIGRLAGEGQYMSVLKEMASSDENKIQVGDLSKLEINGRVIGTVGRIYVM